MSIDKFISPDVQGYMWFVYVVDSGHVLAQGYHRSAKIAENQMNTAYLLMQDEFGAMV